MRTDIDLPWELSIKTPIALDTEGSGLFVDGDWGKAPEARVSVVSLAWYEPCWTCGGEGQTQTVSPAGIFCDPHDCEECDGKGEFLHSRAFPFDQGRVAGKPGRFNKITGQTEPLDKTEDTPWNLDHTAWDDLAFWLQGRPIVCHNLKYDSHIMKAGLRGKPRSGIDINAQAIHDTMIVQSVLSPLESSGLKPTARRLWGEDEGDEQQAVKAALKKNGVGLTWRYDLLPWAGLMDKYATKDAEQTIRLFRLHTDLRDNGVIDSDQQRVIDREMALSHLLYKMEQRGIGFDAGGCLQQADLIKREMAKIEERLPFDPSKPAQAKKYYFGPVADGGLGLVPQKVTEKTRAPQLDAQVMRELAEQGQPHAADLVEYAHLSSAVAKWYVGWPMRTGRDGRLRTNFRQNKMESDRPGNVSGGAISGRLSVERVQLQAIPHASKIPNGVTGVRSFFQPKAGHALWELDLSQAEVRIATWAARCKPMAEVLAAGSDVHGSTATTVFGVKPGDPDWFELRQVAKRLTFAMLYGAGVNTTRAQIVTFTGRDYGESKTRAMIEKYRSTFPEFVSAARMAQYKADKGLGGPGFVRLAGGRRRYFGWGERTHKAFNAVIQGGQAEIAKEWMLETERQHPGLLLLMIHDSVVLEIPEGDQDRVVKSVCEIGESIFESYFSTEEIPIKFKVDSKPWGAAE